MMLRGTWARAVDVRPYSPTCPQPTRCAFAQEYRLRLARPIRGKRPRCRERASPPGLDVYHVQHLSAAAARDVRKLLSVGRPRVAAIVVRSCHEHRLLLVA